MPAADDQASAHAETRRVIHDLRQPLAAMQVWVDLLAEALHDQVGEKETRYLAKIRAEVTRMGALLANSASAPAAPPSAAPRAADAKRADGARLAGVSLLVVEDDAMTAEALQLALEGEGATVAVAATIADGLALFAARRPDGVLSDLRVSDGDGYALVAEIRRCDQVEGRRTVALAVTGFDGDETRAASRAAGFDALLSKPFAIDHLIESVARLIAAR